MATLSSLLSKFGLKNLKLNAGFMQMEFESSNATRQAAWELYVELLTRVATQALEDGEGDEEAALKSLYALFPVTREILRKSGPDSVRIAYIAIPFLNQVVRPFTSKWHPRALNGDLSRADCKQEFRTDLAFVRRLVSGYADLMGELADVELERVGATELQAR